MKKFITIALFASMTAVGLNGCGGNYSNTDTYTIGGAAAGGVIGAAATRSVVGGAVGAVAGGVIGNQIGKSQDAKYRNGTYYY